MIEYEINFLTLQSKTEQLETVRKSVKDLIKNFEGKITGEVEFKKRKLAYEIKKENYGFFTVLRFETESGEKLFEIKKQLNLNENIARYLIVRADQLPALVKIEDLKEESLKKQSLVKQEDLEKILADEKKKPIIEKKKEVAVKEIKPEVKQEKDEKEQSPIAETNEKEETPVKKEVAKKPVKKETVKKSSSEKEDGKEKTATKKKTVRKDQPTEEKEASKKTTLEEIDKKLEEILDI